VLYRPPTLQVAFVLFILGMMLAYDQGSQLAGLLMLQISQSWVELEAPITIALEHNFN